MSSSSALTGIPSVLKLIDQNNYHTWKGTSKIILTYIGCWDLVSGVIKRPKSEASSDIYTISNSSSEWDRISNKALSFLVMNIDQSLIPLISSCENAAMAWTTLADKFDRKNAVSLHSLIKAITTLTYDEKTSLSNYLSTFDSLWACLKE
jgi:gag-polypeptide of LTR copia-type